MESEKAHHYWEPLRVASTATDGVTVVSVSGEIDHDSAGPLAQALASDRLGERPRVVVDMRRVTFMDSTGINILINAHRHLTRAAGWLRLAGTPDSILRTLQIVGIDMIIACHPNLRDALAA
ncbi:STAS domain-containing protein [Streptomyces sp900105245]|uniref:Anti-sigma factor antagonist n=1 Tax=Streptomyces sp. 900105245 TaxID=3154379 RepID=A0ABV1UKV2_9ACTN